MKNDMVFIRHIVESISDIELFIEGVSKRDFVLNKEKQSAVIRQIEVIGEAVKNISDDFKNKYPKIEWRKIAGTRDKIIHNYFGIDLDIIWDVDDKFYKE